MNPFYRRAGLRGYAIGLACVLLAFTIRWCLQPVLQGHAPLMLFVLAAMLAALSGGPGPGIVAMVVGELLGDFFFIPPLYTLGPRGPVEWAYCLTFLAETSTVILVVEALRRTRDAELDQRVRERTAALEAANRELEAFTYSVSHDLRAPVRSITGFSKALLEDYTDKLDTEGQQYLRYAYEAGVHMSRLIDDLIELSRASSGELRHQTVNLSALATYVLNELRRRDPEREVDVTVEPGLIAEGDEGLLRIALENLLDNAWKFTKHRPHARIEVGANRQNQNGSQQFFIRDNGAGFSMAEANRLFGAFQRLHSETDFPGTGIGLATVRRILTRHGGQVWAEGKPNEGATFYFSLPQPITAVQKREKESI